MEHSIYEIMEQADRLNCSEKDKKIRKANDLVNFKRYLNTTDLTLKMALSDCQRIKPTNLGDFENAVGLIRLEIEETKVQVDNKLKYWIRHATNN